VDDMGRLLEGEREAATAREDATGERKVTLYNYTNFFTALLNP